ncbi:MAG: A/G-specific adenine glycosylase [Betaproteobacteria bacterium]
MRPEAGFAARIVSWQQRHGRHDLPWQTNRDPYRIWLSEVMLQQTQVRTVIPYYLRFLEQFPDVAALAAAPLERVMELWSGLGYYSRARNLHRCAQTIVTTHGGRFPASSSALAELPGVGRSTAAAIAAFAFGERAAILDGNVKRVLCRHFGVEGWPGERQVEQRLWDIAQRELPQTGIGPYTQGLMDLGAQTCTRTRPQCDPCPVAASCMARAQGRQASLPASRPARATPVRETCWAVVIQNQRVLLERRPPAGIWGGLLSLPEISVTEIEHAAAQVETRFGVTVTSCHRLSPVMHAFTHFRLIAHPVLIEVTQAARLAADTPHEWFELPKAGQLALAQPVRTLLLNLLERSAAQAPLL